MVDMHDLGGYPTVTVRAYFSKTEGFVVYTNSYTKDLVYRSPMMPIGFSADLRNESDSIVRPNLGCGYADTAHAWPPTSNSSVIDTTVTWIGDTTRVTYMDLYRIALPAMFIDYELDSVEVTKWSTAKTIQLPSECQPPASITRTGVMVLRAISAEGTVVRHW
jgi:hypothetical protein